MCKNSISRLSEGQLSWLKKNGLWRINIVHFWGNIHITGGHHFLAVFPGGLSRDGMGC